MTEIYQHCIESLVHGGLIFFKKQGLEIYQRFTTCLQSCCCFLLAMNGEKLTVSACYEKSIGITVG